MFIRGNELTNELEGLISIIFYLEGCSQKCWFCLNKELFTQETVVKPEEVEETITNHIDYIDAIIISGGEPLEQPEAVRILIDIAKKYNLKVGLNTNGKHKEELMKVIENIDFLRLGIIAGVDTDG